MWFFKSMIIILMLHCLSSAVIYPCNFSVHITQLQGKWLFFEILNMFQRLILHCASIVINIPHNARVFYGCRWIQIQYYPLQVHYRKSQHAKLLFLGKNRHLVSARHMMFFMGSWKWPGLSSLKGICQKLSGLRSLLPGKLCV